ncbi:MAG: site-2 protease family protein [Candidatus Iainarchaeum archaeon]|uniref:Site-2 protease family protein n=1 Tax=Candidatus Iainarchaeum sp. TaxID=3101447 RepID=A0A7T9DJ41_9ARCH|nr:MAG: site-2 protease family protein [Candidatus Diapherotrites archaeon]
MEPVKKAHATPWIILAVLVIGIFFLNPIYSIILSVLVGTTYLIKHFLPQAQTWYVMSMVRFTKQQKIFDLFVNHGKLLNWLTDIGLVIGFGAIAVDYLWLQKKKMWQRVLGFLAAAIILGAGVGFIFPIENPIIPVSDIVVRVAFGLFGTAGFVLVSLFYSGLDIIQKITQGKNACAGVAPVIPGVSLPNSPITVPLHAWLSFVIILIWHEASHGFVVRKLGMKLKSYGLLLLGFLPIGAFVEPDEKQLKALEKKSPLDALRLYAAGPASNFYFFIGGTALLAVLGMAIFTPFIAPALTEIHSNSVSGLEIVKVEENIVICGTEFPAPAHNVLQPGDQILAVNGASVHTTQEYFAEIVGKEQFELEIKRGEEVRTESFEPNDLGRIGINVKELPNENYTPPGWYEPLIQVFGFLAGFVGWLLILNFLVAVANFIPVDPFDGGKMVKLLLFPYFGFLKMGEEDTKKFIARIFIVVLLVLILINALPLVIVHP